MSPESSRPAGTDNRAKPESLRARAFSVSLTVKDLRKSMAWYRDVVGFTVERQREENGVLRSVALKAGDVAFLLNQDDGAKGWDRVKGQGLSLRLTTAQSVDALAQRIRERGGTLDSEPADMPWGARLFRLRDPDGFAWSISSET
jgi:uncharacterized glyoxalase superfamily protein PhnB